MKAFFSFTVMIVLLLALGVAGFSRARHAARMAEAPENLRRLYESAVHYAQRYLRGPMDKRLRASFPSSSGITPESPCCAGARAIPCIPGGRGPAGYNPEEWKKPPFSDFAFEIKDPHIFRYAFSSGGPAAEIPFEASAYKDADCDGRLSRLYRKGVVRDGFVGGPLEIFTENPQE